MRIAIGRYDPERPVATVCFQVSENRPLTGGATMRHCAVGTSYSREPHDPERTLSLSQVPHARARRAGDPGSCSHCVRPGALNLCIEADVAAGTRGNPRPECQFAGAARASGACHWSVEKRPNNRSEEPEIEQKRREHPKTVKHARGMFGIEPDKHGGQDNHQEPSEAASNVQLQLELLPHTHGPIVLPRELIRLLSHPADMSVFGVRI